MDTVLFLKWKRAIGKLMSIVPYLFCIYVYIVYVTHRLSVYILYGHTNDALILITSYFHNDFSYVHECILAALNCAVFVLLMHVFLWLPKLLLLYIVRNVENKDDQSIYSAHHLNVNSCVLVRIDELAVVCPIGKSNLPQISKFMGPTWGQHGSCRPQMGPILAPWTLLSGRLAVAKLRKHLQVRCTSYFWVLRSFKISTNILFQTRATTNAWIRISICAEGWDCKPVVTVKRSR